MCRWLDGSGLAVCRELERLWLCGLQWPQIRRDCLLTLDPLYAKLTQREGAASSSSRHRRETVTQQISHYSVTAGLSEAVNYSTLAEAQRLARAQSEAGLSVRLWAVTTEGEWIPETV